LHLHIIRDQVAGEAEGVWQNHVEQLQADHSLLMDRLTADLNSSRTNVKALKNEIAVLKDSTLIGEKQREIESMRIEHDETLLLLKEMSNKLEGTVSDRDQLAGRLTEEDKLYDERNTDRLITERTKVKMLENKIQNLMIKTSDDLNKYQELEIEKSALSAEVDDLTNWKAVYESGHGLQELARNQRSLKGWRCIA
jgi:hypothetical protein